MRTFQFVFLITLALFLGGVATAQQQTSEAAQPAAPVAPCALAVPAALPQAAEGKPPLAGTQTPKAKMKDIMNSMIVPSSNIIFGAVATTTDATGVHESKPETDDQWNNVFANAVMLTEAANTLMVPGRQRCLGGAIPLANRVDFNQKARELIEAGTVAMVAAQKHDTDGITEAGERLDVACDACHMVYQIVEDDPEGYKGKVLGTYKPPAPKK